MVKIVRIFMILLYSILALGAFISGGMLIIDPSGKSMGLTRDLLNNTFFHNYLIPGILLFGVIGLSQVLAAIKLKSGGAYTKEMILFAGFSILSWIVVQLSMLGYVFFLQAIILIVAALELLYAIKYKP
ncbi:MAG: hypothetical protein K0R18_2945 [Bacillales bacterium]|jgi:hypothetical protein|nr:hypothetical protein [Bacillales bacterium]